MKNFVKSMLDELDQLDLAQIIEDEYQAFMNSDRISDEIKINLNTPELSELFHKNAIFALRTARTCCNFGKFGGELNDGIKDEILSIILELFKEYINKTEHQ